MFTIWYTIAAHGIAARSIDVCGLADARFIWDAMKASGCAMRARRP